MAALIVKANRDIDALTPEQRLRLFMLFVSFLNLWHSAYTNYSDGLLDEGTWQVWDRGMVVLMKDFVAIRMTWSEIGGIYSDAFQAHAYTVIARRPEVVDPAAAVKFLP